MIRALRVRSKSVEDAIGVLLQAICVELWPLVEPAAGPQHDTTGDFTDFHPPDSIAKQRGEWIRRSVIVSLAYSRTTHADRVLTAAPRLPV